ncbi:MAG: ATP-dependent helicase, partial [Chloroflexi bacterium]|nr:ATP-dependent helicase [Chloroflexota bacterium]
MALLQHILNGLNAAQHFAVTQTEGPIQLIAGAGSGKTGVLTRRVAYLLKRGLSTPESVLTVTFTTKAAAEMRARLGELIEHQLDALNIGTLHALCWRMVKADASLLGYASDKLRVVDAHDAARALQRAIAECRLDQQRWGLETIAQAIARAKNELRTPEQLASLPHDYYQTKLAQVYATYQRILKAENAVDFDDLQMLALRLLREHVDVRQHYQDLFAYVLVDEFQDTSLIQYELLQLLAAPRQNLTVVGSPSQAIYGWRGAPASRVFAQFELEFPTMQVIVLDQNYRNSGNILRAANAIISGLNVREQHMWTANPPGAPIRYRASANEFDEARIIAQHIRQRVDTNILHADECAILVRTKTLMRAIEQALVREGPPYTLEDTKFFNRREIRDLLAYLHVAHDPMESGAAIEQIINTPPRGLGPKAQAAIRRGEPELNYERVLRAVDEDDLDEQVRASLAAFNELVAGVLYPAAGQMRLPELLDFILERTGYRAWTAGRADGQTRLANLDELRAMLLRYPQHADNPRETLLQFLNDVALMSDSDPFAGERDGGVKVFTVHAAKGLEWRLVFVVGMEEGLFPHALSMHTRADLNEERR